MYCGKKPVILKPEERLSIECADFLRVETLANRINGIWTHVPNEGKRNWLTALILKAMGMLSGALDFWFIHQGGGVIIELKFEDGKISPFQGYFMQWADDQKIPREVVYSFEQFKGALVRHGVWRGVLQ
jgi:hypothetical protein